MSLLASRSHWPGAELTTMSSLSQQTVSQETTPATTTEVATSTTSSGRGNQAAVSAAGLDSSSTETSTTDAAAGTAAGLEVLGEDAGAVLDAMPLEVALKNALPNQHIAAVAAWIDGLQASAITACSEALLVLLDFVWPVGMSVSGKVSGTFGLGVSGTISGTGSVERSEREVFSLTLSVEQQAEAGIGGGGAVSGVGSIPITGAEAEAGMAIAAGGTLSWSVDLGKITENAVAFVKAGSILDSIAAWYDIVKELPPESVLGAGGISGSAEASGGLGAGGQMGIETGATVETGYETNDSGKKEAVLRLTRGMSASAVAGVCVGIETVVAALSGEQVLEVRGQLDDKGSWTPDVYFRLITTTGDAGGTVSSEKDYPSITSVLSELAASAMGSLGIASEIDLSTVTPMTRSVDIGVSGAESCAPVLDFLDSVASYTPTYPTYDIDGDQRFSASLEVGSAAVEAATSGGAVEASVGEVQDAIAGGCVSSAIDETIEGVDVAAGLAAAQVSDAALDFSYTLKAGSSVELKLGAEAEASGEAELTVGQKLDLEVTDPATLAQIYSTASIAGVSLAVTTPAAEAAPESATEAGSTETGATENGSTEAGSTETGSTDTSTCPPKAEVDGAALGAAARSPFAQQSGPQRPQNSGRGHHNVRPGPFGRRMQDAA